MIDENKRYNGVVLYYDDKDETHNHNEQIPPKRFGYITVVDDNGQPLMNNDSKPIQAFVHFSEIKMDGYQTLEEGQIVNFKLERTDRGFQAKDVQHGEKGMEHPGHHSERVRHRQSNNSGLER